MPDPGNFTRSQSDRIEAKLDLALDLLRQVLRKETIMAAEFDNLVAQVKANADAEAGAVLAIHGLADEVAKLAGAGGTPAQFAALAAQLKASADALGAAVVANTPHAPPA